MGECGRRCFEASLPEASRNLGSSSPTVGAARRFKKVENATAVIWKLLVVAESRFKVLNEKGLLTDVYEGVEFVNGEREQSEESEVAA